MKRKLFLLLFITFPHFAEAHPYEHAGGIRAGYSSGITYKGFFLHRMTAVGIDALYNPHGLNISALYEFHREVDRKGRLLACAGGGVFGGTWDEELSAGLCTVFGIEYTIRKLPLNFGAEWKPMLKVTRVFAYDLIDFGITIRYRFGL